MSSGAYTIECWFYNSANWSANRGLLGGARLEDGIVGCMSLFFTDNISVTTDKYGGGGQRTYTMNPISLNAWHHFALVRNASQIETVFIDGVKAIGAAGGTSVSGGQQVNTIDYNGATRDICKYYGGAWTGYITNMRIVVPPNINLSLRPFGRRLKFILALVLRFQFSPSFGGGELES
jgi:hypothetical protein